MAKAKTTLSIGMATMQLISNFVCAMPKILSHDTVQTICIQIEQYQTISNNNVNAYMPLCKQKHEVIHS